MKNFGTVGFVDWLGGGRENWWGPNIFFLDQPSYNLSKMEKK